MLVARAIDNMAGGVEKMAISLMNAMIERGNEVELFTWDLSNAMAFYSMSAKINWYKLNMGNPWEKAGFKLIMKRALIIRNHIKQCKPDIIVCFQAGPFISMRIYTLGMGIPFIAAERNAPSLFDHVKKGLRKSFIMQGLFFADRITIQCESYRSLYPAFLQKKICTIPNPVYPVEVLAHPQESLNGRFGLLSVGRLEFQKNYAALIRAFERISANFPEWDLVVVGEGGERYQLEKLIEELGIVNRVILTGIQNNVTDWYAQSHVFCLPSRWEGFPNALAEALAHGLPCVGFKDCSGVSDLLVDGYNGLLASGNDNVESLADSLKKLMSNPDLRKKMGNNASISMQKYKPEIIFDGWEALFKEIADKKKV